MTKHLRTDLPFPSEEQLTEMNWAVIRETCPAQPTPCRGTRAVAHLPREWGGEFAMRRYYTTAAAKMLAAQFGADLGKFLSVAENADPADLIDVLRESVACSQDVSAAPVRPKSHDEPPLPFVDGGESVGGSVHHC